ncbi:hypothetical protein AHAS_Ahas15G0283600 [Arachis hypogaea]
MANLTPSSTPSVSLDPKTFLFQLQLGNKPKGLTFLLPLLLPRTSSTSRLLMKNMNTKFHFPFHLKLNLG